MTKDATQSFLDYQKSLLEKGMAVVADCTLEGTGKIIFNRVVTDPSCDLLSTTRKETLKALSEEFLEHHKFMQGQKSDEQYLEELVNDFNEEQRYSRGPVFEWLDADNPKNGIIAEESEDVAYYFELLATPFRLKALWKEGLIIATDPKTDKKVSTEFETYLGECEDDLNVVLDINNYWFEIKAEMVEIKAIIYNCFSSEKKYYKVRSHYLNQVLAPIFDCYKEHHFYVASPDITYFVIGRPSFYPIIAGERMDGSHEITIFDAYNEI